ncbi:AraC family transcriptional regulator [Poseidonibacter ostreae]|jgi:AraC-like DNA-binding protein|uniref:Helix-turn-helix domain-containing protein n=1 Tax=Poseidonibacter ostreae TaxID=2654171 RepID=A0A6L4WVM1_9BACT|nr:AraC family transcriptional regulator [Poseidonibacter ostreae]KAB7886506.1 helix-turn-helix domain-containing protein [Poseidonibacter ostreae]KAB7890645.1 helix-turn-helix domain-containing protein [Poseidonibacter ostreae]KAB7892372.1 helix-turn-helix domain-containing protein [Poseidonibacter ostreae]
MNTKILEEVNKLIKEDSLTRTNIKGVNLYKTTTYLPRTPLTYDFCLVFVLQGKKIGYLSNNRFEYDSKNYLVVPTAMPFECETYASKEEPYICILIDIKKEIMQEIISSISKEESKKCEDVQISVFQDKVTNELEDSIYRLLKMLQSKEESNILGESILREIFYKIAIGENSHFLHKMFLENKAEAKMIRSLRTIHHEYNEHLDIPRLAKEEDMSVSSFHTHFKKVTSLSPLQYIKKIRLHKAMDLLTRRDMQVNETAYATGYESSSQFSKDFKSYYGYPPKEAKASFEII